MVQTDSTVLWRVSLDKRVWIRDVLLHRFETQAILMWKTLGAIKVSACYRSGKFPAAVFAPFCCRHWIHNERGDLSGIVIPEAAANSAVPYCFIWLNRGHSAVLWTKNLKKTVLYISLKTTKFYSSMSTCFSLKRLIRPTKQNLFTSRYHIMQI
jgi:hypothetical protein